MISAISRWNSSPTLDGSWTTACFCLARGSGLPSGIRAPQTGHGALAESNPAAARPPQRSPAGTRAETKIRFVPEEPNDATTHLHRRVPDGGRALFNSPIRTRPPHSGRRACMVRVFDHHARSARHGILQLRKPGLLPHGHAGTKDRGVRALPARPLLLPEMPEGAYVSECAGKFFLYYAARAGECVALRCMYNTYCCVALE